MKFGHRLTEVVDAPPILADHPEYVAPPACDVRYEMPPLVDEADADVCVRAWRYWYNARGIVETSNRLRGDATAVVVVHPWGVDDGHGLRTPEPAGVALMCTPGKNAVYLAHVREVLNPLLARLRPRVAVVGYSMPGVEDDLRRKLYASIRTAPGELDVERGERELRELLDGFPFAGGALPSELELDAEVPVPSYFSAAPSIDAGDAFNGPGFWQLPMPLPSCLDRAREDLVFYDDDGYPAVRDYLKGRGVRHVLLAGYCTDICVVKTTCGYQNLGKDFNLFLVGDATLAAFPASTTPRYATQVALTNAALTQMVTQVGWIEPLAARDRP